MSFSLHNPCIRQQAEQHLSQCDTRLAMLIERVGHCRLTLRDSNLFAVLVRSIVGQQVSNRAADSIYQRLEQATELTPIAVAACTVEALRAVGLSQRKINYIQTLAQALDADELNLAQLAQQDDAAIMQALTHYKGIGPWTVEMFLIFGLGRTDVLSVGDLGLRRAAQQLYKLEKQPTPSQFATLAEPWRPYRTIACWYLWNLVD